MSASETPDTPGADGVFPPGFAQSPLRLGVNIDHVATLRNARDGQYPDVVRAAEIAKAAGADGITVHLREDRRHIRDADVRALCAEPPLPINLEMAATEEMQAIALETRPHAVCLVPEKRTERTTEGGLNVAGDDNRLADYIAPLRAAGARVSLFIEADPAQIQASARIGAAVVELHTGAYCHAVEAGDGETAGAELARLADAAELAAAAGLEVHAGHGLTYWSVEPIAALPPVVELNIGHFLVAEAVFVGLDAAIAAMLTRMRGARAAAIADARRSGAA